MRQSVYDSIVVDRYIAEKESKARFLMSLRASDFSTILENVYDQFSRKSIADKLIGVLTRPIVVDDLISILPKLQSSQKIEFLKVCVCVLEDGS